MKCEVCNKPARKNSIVCSDHCQKIRLIVFGLADKYFPTPGCNNCLGDLHGNCTEQCDREFKKLGEFSKDLWSLVELVLARLDQEKE